MTNIKTKLPLDYDGAYKFNYDTICRDFVERFQVGKIENANKAVDYVLNKFGLNSRGLLISFEYRGKIYKPSRRCLSGGRMRWRKTGYLNSELEELGCMSDKEHEAYWREYKMKKETRPIMIQNTNVKTNVETNTIIQFE